jgi:hypothetical protein
VNRLATPLLLAAAALAALTWTQPRLSVLQRRLPALDTPGIVLNADYARLMAAGHDSLVADLALARALSYYGAHYRERKGIDFIALRDLFRLALELDPGNIDACLLAANLLAEARPRDAITLLEEGWQRNPESWKLPEMIGFKYYFQLRDAARAARYYEIAARLPGHPPYVPSLASKFYQESGRADHALRVLYNFHSTTQDKRLKRNFAQMIEKLLDAQKGGR